MKTIPDWKFAPFTGALLVLISFAIAPFDYSGVKNVRENNLALVCSVVALIFLIIVIAILLIIPKG